MSDTPRKPRPNTPSRGPRNPAEEAARLLRSPPVGSAVGDEPPAGIQHVKGGSTEGETLIVGQRLVRQVGPLFDLIRHKDTQMPLTAAIYGPWGSGKTTAMRWLDRMLACWQKEGPKLVSNQQMKDEQLVDVRTVWFYPWKYQNRDDVLRGIIAEVIRATITVHGADARTVQDAIRRFGGFLGRSFLSVLDSVELSGKAGVADAKVDLGFAREIAEEFDRTNHPEKAFLNHFEETLCAWTRRTIPTGKRLVVFIDDLDRCLPRIALQVLEALKLYLRVPEVIFVVGVDRDVIARLVDKIYKEDQVEGVDAARYLAKMFQVEVTLDAEEDLAKGFFEHVTREHGVWAMLEPMPQARQFIREYILHHADRNPREIKRLFNGVMMAAVGELHHEGRAVDHKDWSLHTSIELDALCLLRGARRFLLRHRLEVLLDIAKQAARDPHVSERKRELTETERAYVGCVHDIGTMHFAAFCDQWADAAVNEDPLKDTALRAQVNFETYLILLEDIWLDRIIQLGFEPRAKDIVLEDPKPKSTKNPLAREGSRRPRPPILIEDRSPSYWREAILRAETHELRLFRDAAALGVNKRSDELTDQHLKRCPMLVLAGAEIESSLPLQAFESLTTLDLDSSTITELDGLRGLSGLTVLHLGGTSIADLEPIGALTQLQRLGLGSAAIGDLGFLANLTKLEYLDLSETGLSDASKLKVLKNLKGLKLNYCPVSSAAPLESLNLLEELNLTGTDASQETIESIRQALPKCNVVG